MEGIPINYITNFMHLFYYHKKIKIKMEGIRLLFLVYDCDPNCLHYWGIVVYSVVIWLKMRLKWKTMEYCAKIDYKT
jgi:hypothetical protein